MVVKILNNTTPYGKIRSSHEGSLHSSTLKRHIICYNRLNIIGEKFINVPHPHIHLSSY